MHYEMDKAEHARIFGAPDPLDASDGPGRSRLCNTCGGWHRLDRQLPTPRAAKRGEAKAFIEFAMTFEGDDCLLWPFSLKDNGYVSVGSRAEKEYGHRKSCEARNGPAPTSEHEAAHCCGTRSCLNPRHLRWALHAENHADRIEHGTSNRGETNGNALLTRKSVIEARRLRERGRSTAELAARFGVAEATMRNAIRGKTWGWVA